MAPYKGFTEAQAKAHKKYMQSVATIQLRMEPERRDMIKDYAAVVGESVNAYINRAVDERIEREHGEKSRTTPLASPLRDENAVGVSVPAETEKAARGDAGALK